MITSCRWKLRCTGLKIRKLLVPNSDNPLPPFRFWAQRDVKAGFPNENENAAARLGLFAALGFVYLVAVCIASPTLRDNAAHLTVGTIASLNLIVLLITTVGGIGAIINVIAIPDIRAYNRFSVFIAFFAISGLSLWLTELWREIRPAMKPLFGGIVVALGALSLYDQVLDARGIVNRYASDAAMAVDVGAVVTGMEAIFPERTRVFQLPNTEFPAESGYQHARPYLQSDRFDWSWPSLSPRHRRLMKFLAAAHGETLIRALRSAGFGAVWVDRFGYRDDGRAVIADFAAGGAVEILHGVSQRYAVFDIRGAAPGLQPR